MFLIPLNSFVILKCHAKKCEILLKKLNKRQKTPKQPVDSIESDNVGFSIPTEGTSLVSNSESTKKPGKKEIANEESMLLLSKDETRQPFNDDDPENQSTSDKSNSNSNSDSNSDSNNSDNDSNSNNDSDNNSSDSDRDKSLSSKINKNPQTPKLLSV